MLKWMREGAHRLMGSPEASGGETGDSMGATRNGRASRRGPTRAFTRFLREFRSRNDKVFHEHSPGPRPA